LVWELIAGDSKTGASFTFLLQSKAALIAIIAGGNRMPLTTFFNPSVNENLSTN